MQKKKLDPIDQIHKLARDNGIVVLMIVDDDFQNDDLNQEQLEKAKDLTYEYLMNSFGDATDYALSEVSDT